jgi:hypothetical protein
MIGKANFISELACADIFVNLPPNDFPVNVRNFAGRTN